MGLTHLKDSYAKNLSGGQKRKLSIGIAFIGNPFFVILDEPTSGVDPESRRSVYELISKNRKGMQLIKVKKGKTILITTHHMEETEILGDELILMASGKLLDRGTLLEVKKKYGSSTKLIFEMVILISVNFQSNLELNKETVIDYVYQNCNTVLAHSIRNTEIIFKLKISYKFDESLFKLFYELKTKQKAFGIIMWTLNDCSMEEVKYYRNIKVFINAFENKKFLARDNEGLFENDHSTTNLKVSSLIKLLKTQNQRLPFI
ncbi:hypothetical protein HZS_4502 [Henneguya salminicola]|nr:hypothetical protein HZS_4502 [Henneguya salminicola]